MAVKKSELYSSLWKSCDELRGGMDASQYKDYVLVLLFVKYVSDKDKLTKGSVKAQLAEVRSDPNSTDERELLEQCLELMSKESSPAKAFKEADTALSTLVLEKYEQLSEEEIKQIVVEDKWLATLSSCVQDELNRVTQRLTGRVKELAERYQDPLPVIELQVEECQKRVEQHLKQMGFEWADLAIAGRI